MATLREFVRRFRPAGAPGSAALAGVPVDRAAELAAELAPVFEALRAANQQAADLVSGARHEAEERRRLASERAERVLADARRDAERVRAELAAAASDEAAVERDRLLDRARLDAADVAGRTAERLPVLVDRVVAVVRRTGAASELVS